MGLKFLLSIETYRDGWSLGWKKYKKFRISNFNFKEKISQRCNSAEEMKQVEMCNFNLDKFLA